MCSTPPLNKVHLPIKFHADIFVVSKICSTQNLSMKKGKNSKIRKWRVMVLVHYTSTHSGLSTYKVVTEIIMFHTKFQYEK